MSGPVALLLGCGFLVAFVVASLAWRRAQNSETAADASWANPATPAEALIARFHRTGPTLESAVRRRLLSADQSLRDATHIYSTLAADFDRDDEGHFRASLRKAAGGISRAHLRMAELDDAVPRDDPQRDEILAAVGGLCAQAQQQLRRHRGDIDAHHRLLRNGPRILESLQRRIHAARERSATARATVAHLPSGAFTSVTTVGPDLAGSLLDDAEQTIAVARPRLRSHPVARRAAAANVLHAAALVARAEALLDAVDCAEEDVETARAALPELTAEVQAQLSHAARLLAGGTLAAHESAALRAARSEANTRLAHAQHDAADDPVRTFSSLTTAGLALDAATSMASGRPGPEHAIRASLLLAATRIRSADAFVAGHGFFVGQEARTHLARAQGTLHEAHYCEPRVAADLAGIAGHQAATTLDLAQRDVRRSEDVRRADDRRRHPSSFSAGDELGAG